MDEQSKVVPIVFLIFLLLLFSFFLERWRNWRNIKHAMNEVCQLPTIENSLYFGCYKKTSKQPFYDSFMVHSC